VVVGTNDESVVAVDWVGVVESALAVGGDDAGLAAVVPDVGKDAESDEHATPTAAQPRRRIRSLRMVRPYGQTSQSWPRSRSSYDCSRAPVGICSDRVGWILFFSVNLPLNTRTTSWPLAREASTPEPKPSGVSTDRS
jgi:hypothetical protein